jgi:hypothetical protein
MMDPATMTKLWDAAFPDCSPEATDLKYVFASRWVRIHSLPGSKRYPETEAERQQVLGRSREVLQQLGATAQSTVVCVTQTFSARGNASLSDDPRGGWEWLSWDESPEDPPWPENEPLPDPYERWVHLVVHELSVSELDPLLTSVADDESCGVIVLPPDFAWAFHPYDGGADIIAPTVLERDLLRERFAEWLSPRPDML